MNILRLLAPLLLLSACTPPPVLTPAPAPQEAVLRPGDAVRVAVWRNDELTGEFTVGDDGALVHPLYQQVRVGGLSPAEARARIGEFLQRFAATPQYSVEPLVRVSVGGQVRQPSLHLVPAHTTLRQALLLAGGPTDAAALDRVHLVREGRTYVLDLSLPGGGEGMAVRSGDELGVPRRPRDAGSLLQPIASGIGALASLITLYVALRGRADTAGLVGR